MGFILRAIFYTLLPRTKKARLIVLVLCLFLFGMYSLYSSTNASAYSSTDMSNSDCANIDYVPLIQQVSPTFDYNGDYSWAIWTNTSQNRIYFIWETAGTFTQEYWQTFNPDTLYGRGNYTFWNNISSPTYYGSNLSASGFSTTSVSCVVTTHKVTNNTGVTLRTHGATNPPPVDLCDNLEGNQTTVPDGYQQQLYGEGGSQSRCAPACPPPYESTYSIDPAQCPQPEPPPATDEGITFQQKMGIGIATITGAFVIWLFRYRGEA